MDKWLELLFKQLNLTEEDAIVAALFAIIGYSVDVLFFPAGLASSSVAILSGATGVVTFKMAEES
jgi:hypothetical protein